MYTAQQRDTDPRYAPVRQDSTSSMYSQQQASGDNYAGYPQQSYNASMSYGGYGSNVGISGYQAGTSPATASRRTSGPKAATPPATSATTTQSPSHYYPSTSGTDPRMPPQQSPYSAPPHMVGQGMNQPQTAQPYGYDQYNNHYQHQGYPNYYQGQYTSQSAARPQSGAATTPVTATPNDHRSQPSSSAYDYSQPGSYPGYGNHDNTRYSQQWQQQQQPGRSGSFSQQSGVQHQQQYQGYHHGQQQTMPPHHMAPGQMQQGQYGQWNQWGQYGYPPQPGMHPAQTAVPPTPTTGKKGKKGKGEDDGILGKRTIDSATEDEGDDRGKKGKKGKKEPIEKPPPKMPAKSHLKPPRQAQSAWQIFFNDELNKAKAAAVGETSPGGTVHPAKLNVAQIAKDAGAAYASLDDEQKTYYAQKVIESKEQYSKDLAVWQATLTPEDIRQENAFRAQQRKEGKSRKGNLKDPNAPKKPLSAYFLFLKGIREDDALRARVWGEESETTKQSVLAAERWRNLSDDEKRPFLQQAEKDKQDYEELRKIYESDAAAKARGEDVPDRPELHDIEYHAPKPVISGLDQPSAIMASGKLELDVPKEDEDSFAAFTHDDDADDEEEAKPADGSLEMDEFHGFHDPLSIDGMDLGGFQGVTGEDGFQGVTGEDNNGHQEQWDELQQLMGDGNGNGTGVKMEQAPPKPDEDVSEAPALHEAEAETAAEIDTSGPPVQTEADVDEIARQAEGDLVVPPAAEDPLPTEAVNELPAASLPEVDNEPPADASTQIESTDLTEPAPESSSAMLSEPLSEQITTPAPSSVDPALAEQPKDSFDAAALTGTTIPEVVADDFNEDDASGLGPGSASVGEETVEPATEAMLESGGDETVGHTEPGAMDGV